MSAPPPEPTGLIPQYQSYERQKCFIAYSEQAPWAPDLLSACEEVLNRPEFNLEPDHARKHFKPDSSLLQKALELIANARYGIYDLSYWQNNKNEWHIPGNVFIEFGIAIALNRPAMLLRHVSNRKLELPECLESVSGNILEFSGELTLAHELNIRLPKWIAVDPEQDWHNRFCIFGGRSCKYRETYPLAQENAQGEIHCLVSAGLDSDRVEFSESVREVLGRFSHIRFDFLDGIPLNDQYELLLCTYCQELRRSPFAIYRLTSETSPATLIAIGMSLAFEEQFGGRLHRVLITDQMAAVPTLLSGYEILVANNTRERRSRLRECIPTVMRSIQGTLWRPRPLPFVDIPRAADRAYPTRDQSERTTSVYVGQQGALDSILARVSNRSEPLLLNLYGGAGIGKTRLLVELVTLMRNRSPEALILLVDLAEPSFRKPGTGPQSLTRMLATQLMDSIQEENGQIASQVAALFDRHLSGRTRMPIMLIFDSTEAVQDDAKFWQWMEEDLIEPLVSRGIHLLFAGRLPAPWRSFQVRRRLQIQELQPLSAEGEAQSLARNAILRHNPALEGIPLQSAVDTILEFSFGHPLLSQELAAYIVSKWPPSSGHEFRRDLCSAIVRPFVETYLLRDVEPVWNQILWYASILNLFDNTILHEYLERLHSGLTPSEWDSFFIRGIDMLRHRGQVRWAQGGYRFWGVAADIMRRCLSVMDPQLYRRGCEAAADLFEHLANEFDQGGEESKLYLQDAATYRELARGGLSAGSA